MKGMGCSVVDGDGMVPLGVGHGCRAQQGGPIIQRHTGTGFGGAGKV